MISFKTDWEDLTPSDYEEVNVAYCENCGMEVEVNKKEEHYAFDTECGGYKELITTCSECGEEIEND